MGLRGCYRGKDGKAGSGTERDRQKNKRGCIHGQGRDRKGYIEGNKGGTLHGKRKGGETREEEGFWRKG